MHLLLQQVPSLLHAAVIEYVTALQSGPAPLRLVAIATEALVPALNPVVTVRTIRPGQRTVD